MHEELVTSVSPGTTGIPFGECRPKEALDRLGGMRDLYSEVLDRFLEDRAGTLAKLHSAADSGDLIRASRRGAQP